MKELLTIDGKESVVGLNVIGNVNKNMRAVCSHSMFLKTITLGGYGKFFEIDESLVAKMKCSFGKALDTEQIWIFGLVERGKEGEIIIIFFS